MRTLAMMLCDRCASNLDAGDRGRSYASVYVQRSDVLAVAACPHLIEEHRQRKARRDRGEMDLLDVLNANDVTDWIVP